MNFKQLPTWTQQTQQTYQMIVVSLGLNPALQQTLSFASQASSGEQHGWERGKVNRAKESWVQVGGKGQTFARAISKCNQYSDKLQTSQLQIRLIHVLAGATGSQIDAMLAADEGIEQRSLWLPVRSTRTCTTLIDKDSMTELIEPTASYSVAEVGQVLKHVSDSLADLDGVCALSINGTFPAGIQVDTVFGIVATAINSRVEQKLSCPLVMVDAFKGIAQVLMEFDIIDIIKVNEEEISQLSSECKALIPSATECLCHRNVEKDQQAIAKDVCTVMQMSTQVHYVIVTRGGLDTLVFCRSSEDASSFSTSSCLTVRIVPTIGAPNKPIVNPIGAGDTFAAAFLSGLLNRIEKQTENKKSCITDKVDYRDAVKMLPAESVFNCAELASATATASCFSKYSADFNIDDVEQLVSKLINE